MSNFLPPIDPIEIDPILLQEDLDDRIQRYLKTALPIHPRFPKLREMRDAQLKADNLLLKGPYLESLPDFPKGASLESLVTEGVIHNGFSKLVQSVYERPLHQHQEDAIRAVVEEQENIIVATGTGSGKTESFFFPLLDSLLKEEGIADKDGIRAILIYPMNALANDQLDRRLVPVLADQLKDYGITVGRFTGQTERDKPRRFIEESLTEKGSYFSELFGTNGSL